MASRPDAEVAAEGQPGEARLPAPGRWRKKPAEVEAMHWDGYPVTATVIIDWMLANGGTARYHDDPSALSIDTPDGTMTAVPGDWIVKDAEGFRPYEDLVFTGDYEPADGPRSRPGDQPPPSEGRGPSMHDLGG